MHFDVDVVCHLPLLASAFLKNILAVGGVVNLTHCEHKVDDLGDVVPTHKTAEDETDASVLEVRISFFFFFWLYLSTFRLASRCLHYRRSSGRQTHQQPPLLGSCMYGCGMRMYV